MVNILFESMQVVLRFSTKRVVGVRWSSTRHPQWYKYRRPTEPHEICKDFFDRLYGKQFGKDWPSIRCAMLSRKKYAAILNNYAVSDEVEEDFIMSGAVDIVKQMHDNARSMLKIINDDIKQLSNSTKNLKRDLVEHMDQDSREHSIGSDIRNPETVTSENGPPLREFNWLQERYSIYEDLSTSCNGLSVYAYPKSDITEFSDPMEQKFSKSILDYFVLDGSSILPVLALDPKPHEHVFDICAAPGGKFMCLMQILKDGSGTIVANDKTISRSNRIRKIQDEYIPKNSANRKSVKVTTLDARDWHQIETAVYDKVLVDVPCTTDRHSMLPTFEQRDNIFCQLRKRERGDLPILQSDILRSAILSCRPGGTIVYSTCTASPQQNEHVVQMAVQELLHNHGVLCRIEDLTPMTHLLHDHFYFYNDITLGALALPFLDANYGPTYICKLVRVS